jgi:hypothetical protein
MIMVKKLIQKVINLFEISKKKSCDRFYLLSFFDENHDFRSTYYFLLFSII